MSWQEEPNPFAFDRPRRSRRGAASRLPWLVPAIVLTVSLLVVLGIYLYHRHRQVADLDEHYSWLLADEEKVSNRITVLRKQLSAARQGSQRDEVISSLNHECFKLLSDYEEMEHVLRDRMGMAGVRPGDHRELARIQGGQELARGWIQDNRALKTLMDARDELGGQGD